MGITSKMYVDEDGAAYSIEPIKEDRENGYLTDEEFAKFKKSLHCELINQVF